MQPLVGVIVPCFNQGRFAAECIASLHAQTYANWRAAVVNDASTDDSAALLDALRSDRVEIVHLRKNLGRALVRNEAVRRLGEVDFVLNVDCDDELSPDYIAKLVAAMSDRTGLAYGTLHYFGAITGTTWPRAPLIRERRFLENVIPGPGAMFRAAALRQTRGWRADFTAHSGEDYDIWLQVAEAGWEVAWVRDAVYHYRQHEQSFLARSDEWTQVEVQLNIARHHARAIRREHGFEPYLKPIVLPALLANIRRFQVRRAARVLRTLLRVAPLTTLRLLARHYASRAILRRR